MLSLGLWKIKTSQTVPTHDHLLLRLNLISSSSSSSSIVTGSRLVAAGRVCFALLAAGPSCSEAAAAGLFPADRPWLSVASVWLGVAVKGVEVTCEDRDWPAISSGKISLSSFASSSSRREFCKRRRKRVGSSSPFWWEVGVCVCGCVVVCVWFCCDCD